MHKQEEKMGAASGESWLKGGGQRGFGPCCGRLVPAHPWHEPRGYSVAAGLAGKERSCRRA